MSDNIDQDVNAQEVKNDSKEKKSDSKSKKSKKKGILIGIIIVLFLAVAGLGSYFTYTKFFKAKKSTKVNAAVKKSKYRLSGNGLEDFDLRFLQLENGAENKIYSPLSIKYALAMLQEGAKGETKKQITNLIGDYKAKKYPNNEHMSFANAMFIRNTFKDNVREEYTNNLKEKYNAEVILDDFSSPDNINNWVSDRTFNLVNNLLDKVDQNNFFLINALAIDMNWKNQIHCASGSDVQCLKPKGYHVSYKHEKIPGEEREYSKVSYPYVMDSDFPRISFDGKDNVKTSEVLANFNRYDAVNEIGEDKIREIVGQAYREWLESEEGKQQKQWDNNLETDVDKYLDKYIEELNENNGKSDFSTDFLLYDDENVKSFAKDLQEYDNITLQYVGIMPKNDSLDEFIKNNQAKDINKIIRNLKEMKKESFKDGVVTIVHGNIPFFKYEYQLKLEEDLQSLGIKNIFDINKADLSGMLDGSKQFINPAIHKANIEFSNDGIKAAAATAFGGMGASSGGFNYLFEVPVEEIDLTFDKPYMYIIRDKATGEVWFTGTVYEPSTN